MKFHLNFTPKNSTNKIAIHDRIMLMGSCFTENIGEKLKSHKFAILQNPNGILFNPVSVTEALNTYLLNKRVATGELFYLDECYHSWHHHSRYSGPNPQAVIDTINQSTADAHEFLRCADFLMITLGSAWIYELTAAAPSYIPGKVAANNHKAPSQWFQKRLLEMDEVFSMLQTLTVSLKRFNPTLKVLFTISPVRHLREGFVENNRSKAVLISAVHRVVDEMPGSYYFPAYELVIDDLRDYRFYSEDLVHPNYAATNYVWQKFVTACITDDSQSVMKEINEINAARSHKAFNPASEAHCRFLHTYKEKLYALIKRYPKLNFADDIRYFEAGDNYPPGSSYPDSTT